MRPSAVYRPSEQARYRVCQCEPAAVSHGQSCRRKRERQTSLFLWVQRKHVALYTWLKARLLAARVTLKGTSK